MTNLVIGVVDERVPWRARSSVAGYEAAACSSRHGKEVCLGISGELQPRSRGNLLLQDVPFTFTIPFSKAGFCVLKIPLH